MRRAHIYALLTVYTVYTFIVWEGEEGRVSQREGRGATVQCTQVYFLRPWEQQFTSWVENTNHEWMRLQSIKSVKDNATKSINRSILKKSRHIGFGVFIVHSSMVGRKGLSLGFQDAALHPPEFVHANYAPKLFTEPYIANVSVQVYFF